MLPYGGSHKSGGGSLPPETILMGQFNYPGQGERVFINFTKAILPDGEETAKANKDKLQRLGFHFKYLTHLYTTKTGKTYFYCYDYGYLPLENDWFLIVKKKED